MGSITSTTLLMYIAVIIASKASAEPIQNPSHVCVTGLKDKLKFYDSEIYELKNQLQTTRKELTALTEKQLEHKITAPEDCKEVLNRGYKTSGLYRIKPLYSSQKYWAWCDLNTRGGGWMHVLRRYDGSENFDRNWTFYKVGFGKLTGEFWFGLENFYEVTNGKAHEVLFELMDWNITKAYAHYDKFVVGDASEGFPVKILGKYSGDAGDSFTGHANRKFSTPDRDQDSDSEVNCAKTYHAGWWYYKCVLSHLTGAYVHYGPLSSREPATKISWGTFHGYKYSLKQAKMMIRPTD